MKIIRNISVLTVLAWLSAVCAAQSEPPIAKITAWAAHQGGMVHYRFQVTNLSTFPITSLMLGSGSESGDGKRELSVGPERDPGTNSFWVPARNATRPDGWGVLYVYEEESQKFALRWIEGNRRKSMWPRNPDGPDTPIAKPEGAGIPPGVTWDHFAVKLPKADLAYLNATVLVSNGEDFQEVRISKGDTNPPSLELIAIPIDPPHSRQDRVTFKIQARTIDNVDPSPEVKLEFFGNNNALHNSDLEIQRKQGSWIVEFKQRPGNRYQLCFSAEDASGNKTTKLFEYAVQKGGQGKRVEKNSAPSQGMACSPAAMAKPFLKY